MSAFLGPIHYWLFNKIELQEKMVETILKLNYEKHYVVDLEQQADSICGCIERKPLEEMIDESNIHGWLQEKVSIVESRLSFVVTELINADNEAMSEISRVITTLGTQTFVASSATYESAEQVYQQLNDMLLDGMPCDHVNELVSSSADEVFYRRRMCIHESYWIEQNGSVQHYYEIRSNFIQGFLCETKFTFTADMEGNYHIA